MLHRLGLFTALPLVAFAFGGLGGCFPQTSQFFTGGGWQDGKDGGKATFGFVFNNTQDQGHFKGTYHDPSADVMVRFDGATVDFFRKSMPNGIDEADAISVKVTWIQQGKPQCPGDHGNSKVACTGEGYIEAVDMGEPGASEGDYLCIKLYKFYDHHPRDYYNSGPILGGNLQVHDSDSDGA